MVFQIKMSDLLLICSHSIFYKILGHIKVHTEISHQQVSNVSCFFFFNILVLRVKQMDRGE